MTDDLTPDEAIAEAARALDLKPEPVPGSEGLPDDVADGDADAAPEDDPTVTEEPVVEDHEP